MIKYIKQLFKEAQEQWYQAMRKIEERELMEKYQIFLKETGFPDPANSEIIFGHDILFSRRDSLNKENPELYQRLQRFREFYFKNYNHQ